MIQAIDQRDSSPAEHLRIAIAEDQRALRLVIAELLEQLGHVVVHSAGNGEELLDACRQDPVDVALVDLDMPVMDGLATAEHLSEMGIPVVLVSGHPDIDHVVVANEPVAARLRKPVSKEMLKRAVALAHRRRPK